MKNLRGHVEFATRSTKQLLEEALRTQTDIDEAFSVRPARAAVGQLAPRWFLGAGLRCRVPLQLTLAARRDEQQSRELLREHVTSITHVVKTLRCARTIGHGWRAAQHALRSLTLRRAPPFPHSLPFGAHQPGDSHY